MDDFERAKAWLGRDKLRYMDMLELLRRGTVEALHVWDDGVLLYDTGAGAWFSAVDGRPALEHMLELLPAGTELFVGHEVEYRSRVAERLGISGGHICYQTAWLHEAPPELPADAPPLSVLGGEWAEYVERHYSHSFGGVAYIREAIERGMLGIFQGEELAGFVGFHDEGTIGMLEVLPKFRRQGLGEVLLRGAVRFARGEGKYAFGQVVEGNEPSFALQHKVGMTVCETPMYWVF